MAAAAEVLFTCSSLPVAFGAQKEKKQALSKESKHYLALKLVSFFKVTVKSEKHSSTQHSPLSAASVVVFCPLFSSVSAV